MKPKGRGIASSVFSGIDDMFHGTAKQAQESREEQKRQVVDIGNSDDLKRMIIRLPRVRGEMKSMTCKELGGACDLVFSADTFDELAEQSQEHVKEMVGASDSDHMVAMEKMMALTRSGDIDTWMADRKAEFEAR